MTAEENKQFQESEVCWLCEEFLDDDDDKVRDHDHLTGKYRGSAHNKCNLNAKKNNQVSYQFSFTTFPVMIVT